MTCNDVKTCLRFSLSMQSILYENSASSQSTSVLRDSKKVIAFRCYHKQYDNLAIFFKSMILDFIWF